MENSRNERVYIVVASYVIGFVTAFIAFGVNSVSMPPTTPATVVVATPPAVETTPVSQASTPEPVAVVTLTQTERGLEFVVGEDRQIVSANGDYFDMELTTPEPGYHYALTSFDMSPTSRQVYFCAELTTGAESCNAYLFSVAENAVTPVLVNDEPLSLPAQSHEVVWNQNMLTAVAGVQVDAQ